MDLMEQIVTDLTDLTCCPIDEPSSSTKPVGTGTNISRSKSGSSRAAAWAHRRSRSTSHLIVPSSSSHPQKAAELVHKSESEDTSKGGNDSDDAERSLAKLSLQNTTTPRPLGVSKSMKHSRTCSVPLTKHQSIAESDSLNELFSPTQPPRHIPTTQSKRPRRRHKRMAVEISDAHNALMGAHGHGHGHSHQRDVMIPCSSRTAAASAGAMAMGPPFGPKTAPLVICSRQVSSLSSSSNRGGKKKCTSNMQEMRMELSGKRKRCHRDKSTQVVMASNSAPETSILTRDDGLRPGISTMADLVNLGMDTLADRSENDYEDEDMKSEGSSLDSSSDSECLHPSCDEGQEGDDEHSDWVGDEWVDDMDDSEKRRDLILKRLLNYGEDSREIRAGKRKGFPNKPIFSIRTSANEQLSKFLQNPEQLELKLHPMRKEEQAQLGQLASLYSLQMHCLQDGEGEGDPSGSGLTCPVLTKTPNTRQMDNSAAEEKGIIPCPILSESDTKRIKM